MRSTFGEDYEKRVDFVWRALQARLSETVSQEQLDHAFAYYAYGLTQPLYAESKPADQVDAIIELMMKTLPARRVDQAIRSKKTYDEDFHATCEGLARLGERDALAIIHSNSPSPLSFEPSLTHDASDGADGKQGAI